MLVSDHVIGDPRNSYDPVHIVNVNNVICIQEPVEMTVPDCSHQVRLSNNYEEEENEHVLDLVTRDNHGKELNDREDIQG